MASATPCATVRIFVSSPGDVVDERDRARKVIAQLQKRYHGVTFQTLFWEDLALPATASFQETIDLLVQQTPIDIAVFVLWSRLGSPLGASILRPDGALYRSGTEREFDLMLAAYEQSGGRRPTILAYTRADDVGFQKLLTCAEVNNLGEIVEQRQLVQEFVRERFSDDEGRNTRAYCVYREPSGFADRLRVHMRNVVERFLGADAAVRWDKDPYLGLASFGPQEAAIFYGRDEEICDLLQRLRTQTELGCAFVVIVGASGSGKSSLALAGVAASLRDHTYDDQVHSWRIAHFTPSLFKEDLVSGLIVQLSDVLSELKAAPNALEDAIVGLKQNPNLTIRLSLSPAFARESQKCGGCVRVVLVIDQMEELWTVQTITDERKEEFFEVLEALARSNLVAVVATLRSDFYSNAQKIPAFIRLKGQHGHFDLLPPSPAALQRLIIEPAKAAGAKFERDEDTGITLDQVVLRDACRDPSALPLLQYALTELYSQREESTGTMTYATYARMGGVEGALGRRAAEAVRKLPADAQAALSEILSMLVTIDIDGEQAPVRRRAPRDELRATPARKVLVDSLVNARLLVTDSQQGASVVSLAHEALVRNWEELEIWINKNREHLRIRARVERAQQLWRQFPDSSLLLNPGLPLEEGKQLITSAPQLLSQDTTQYIKDSVAAVVKVATQRRRRTQVTLAVMAVLTTVAVVAGCVGYIQSQRAEKARSEAVGHYNDAITAQKELTAQVYDNSISLAEREITTDNDVEKAMQMLRGEACPDKFRGWEWRYLMSRLKGDDIVLSGHLAGLYGGDFLRDGNTLLTYSIDGTVKWWDIATRKATKSIDADYVRGISEMIAISGKPRRPIMCMAISPDGTTFATGSFTPTDDGLIPKLERSSPGLVRVWSIETGEKMQEFRDQRGVILAMTYSPDGKRLVASSINDENSFAVWDITSGKLVKKVLGQGSQIHCFRFSPDGKILAATDTNGDICFWDATTLELKDRLRAHEAPVVGLAFCPTDGNRLVSSAQDGFIRLWDLTSRQKVLEMSGHLGAVFDVQFSPDGTRVASAGLDKTVRLWDAVTGREKITLRGHQELVWRVNFSHDGQRLVSASFDKTARVWDASFSQELDTDDKRVLRGHTDRVNGLATSEDGRWLVSGSWDKTVRIWSTVDGSATSTLSGHAGAVMNVAISADGQRVLSAGWDRKAILWDRGTGKPLVTFSEHSAPVQGVAFSPDETLAATAGFDGQLFIWRVSDGEIVTRCDGFVFPVFSVAFSPDGTRIASGGTDRKVKIWEVKTGRLVREFNYHQASVCGVAYSHDGKILASAGWDHKVCLWDPMGDGLSQKPRVLEGHKDRVNALSFSPDGRRLATAGEDKTVRIWDVATGKETITPKRHVSVLWGVVFSRDGRKVFSSSWAREEPIRVWDIQ